MPTHVGVDTNLRFLTREVLAQVERTQAYFAAPRPSLLESIRSRDDYIDNLKRFIQHKCFALAHDPAEAEAATATWYEAVEVVTINLERIADLCENVLRQVGYLADPTTLGRWDFSLAFSEILRAVAVVEPAVFERETELARRICDTERALDDFYADVLSRVLAALPGLEQAHDLLTILFIAHYFERMGDALQNIGEAVLSMALGERIKVGQLQSLETALEAMGADEGLGDVAIRGIGETRSGSLIAHVTTQGHRPVIFKEGQTKKLTSEKEGVEQWEARMPGLAPKIYAFQRNGESGAILFEYLSGRTMEDLLVRGPDSELDRAIDLLIATMTSAWTHTRLPEPVRGAFAEQLVKRMPEVYAVHPDFRGTTASVGNRRVMAFADLVDRARTLDTVLEAPFSVFIHGDFNVDNVIYDKQTGRIRFIDLHRSRMMDYIQDLSVLLVSNVRLQVFETTIRRRIGATIRRFRNFGRDFAAQVGDTTHEARLALALARSFATSTRFVLDPLLSKSMFLRARYLLERLTDRPTDELAAFRISEDIFDA